VISTACLFVLIFLLKVFAYIINGLPIPSPSIAVTNIIGRQPYEEGKRLPLEIALNNTVSGLKLRSSHIIAIGMDGDIGFSSENRRENEKMIWQKYEEFAQGRNPELLTSIAGVMTMPIEGPMLGESEIYKLKDIKGFIYFAG
jgi:hypothetical protein